MQGLWAYTETEAQLELVFRKVQVLEILKRARGHSDGDMLPFNANKKDIKEEVNRRTCKAGYTNREGGPPATGKIMTTVSCGEVKLNIWPRDSEGNLIDD